MSTPPPSDGPRPEPVRGSEGSPAWPAWHRPPAADPPTSSGEQGSGERPAGPPASWPGPPQGGPHSPPPQPRYGPPDQHRSGDPQQWGAQQWPAQPGQHAQQPWPGQYVPPGSQWSPQRAWPGQPAPYGPSSGVQTGPYGAPGYPAGSAPGDRTRTILITALVVLSVAIAGAVAALVYALSSTVLDRSAVEAAVAEQFEERHGIALDLACPEDMAVASGEVYQCTGTTADGEEITIEIQIADSLDGAYSWYEM